MSTATNKKKRHKGRQSVSVLTINGRIRVRRVRWHCPQEGASTPADRWLEAAETSISRGVVELCCRLNQGSNSFAATAENLKHAANLSLGKETLRQLVEAEGKQIAQATRRATLVPNWSANDCESAEGRSRVYLGCDGVKVPLVTEVEKQKRRKTVRQKRQRRGRRCKPLPRRQRGADNAYKEFKVALLYDESKQHRYVDVTGGNHEVAGRMMRRMASHVRMREADERVCLIDGAPWIRNQIRQHGLADAIGLDFYHLRDYAQKTRRAVYGEDSSSGRAWLDSLMHTFRHDGYDSAWDELTHWRGKQRGRKRDAANRLLGYVAERHEMIRYPEFRSRGWQIGSGPTEAECKTTTHRVKGRGRRWNSDNAAAMMSLACLHDNGLWDQYWATQEPQRN